MGDDFVCSYDTLFRLFPPLYLCLGYDGTFYNIIMI